MQIALWIFSGVAAQPQPNGIARVLSCCFLAAVSLLAAAGFLIYGGRLFLMLRRSATPASSENSKTLNPKPSRASGCFSCSA